MYTLFYVNSSLNAKPIFFVQKCFEKYEKICNWISWRVTCCNGLWVKRFLYGLDMVKWDSDLENILPFRSQPADMSVFISLQLTERNFTWATMEVVVVFVLLLMSWRRTQSPYITPEIQKLLQNMPSGPGPPKRRRRRNSSTGTIGYSSPHPPLVKHSSESALGKNPSPCPSPCWIWTHMDHIYQVLHWM